MKELAVPNKADKRIGGKRALVFAPHPDDEVFGCAGAIMRHVMDNDDVQVIIVTDGAYPVKDSIDPQSYRKTRQQESIAAAWVLGYGLPDFWGLPDQGVEYGEALVQRMVEAIFASNADTIYAPSVYEAHPDHLAVAMSAIEAVRSLKDKSVLVMYEVAVPLVPNKLLDISDLVERKSEAIHCFKSQLDLQNYARHIESLDTFRTYMLPDTVRAAEAYRILSPQELDDPLHYLASAAFDPARTMHFPSASSERRPLVSILIRSIGRAELRQALSSVALQLYPAIEVIVVNAKGEAHPPVNSTCGRFPVRFIDSQQPIRRSRAANIGLDNAQGKYLMFLDDDDWINADHVSSLVDAQEEIPQVKVVYSGVRSVGDQGDEPDMIFNEDFDPIRLLARNYIPIHAALFSRTLLDKGCRFDEAFDIYEDWDFWLQVAQRTSFYHLDKITANYRVAEGSGMGVKGEPETVRKAASDLYQKWRLLWTEEQLCGLMNYIQEYGVSDTKKSRSHHAGAKLSKRKKQEHKSNKTSSQLFDSSGQLSLRGEHFEQISAGIQGLEVVYRKKNHELGRLQNVFREEPLSPEKKGQSLLGETSVVKRLERLPAEYEQPLSHFQDYIARHVDWLVEEDERASAINRYYQEKLHKKTDQLRFKKEALLEINNKLSAANQRIHDLYASRSWRITAICRAVMTLLRDVSSYARLRFRVPKNYVFGALWVLKTQGFSALIKKVWSKLFTRRSPAPDIPVHYEADEHAVEREVIFPKIEKPDVSIIIPVFNKYRYTINCLESIQKYSSGISYEVILIDDCSCDETTNIQHWVKNIRVLSNDKNLGFVRSCNKGSAIAKGKYIVYLNNDTAVTEGWLKALIGAFHALDNVGFVGAKLVYPDGKLQEAGGIIWSDGSGHNYGRNDDPGDPKYNYMREVDYCSGACIAIERRRFMELGMFDDEYAPAYYEDTDLAFKVREAGMRVVYQPACRVVHYEGVTSGTNILKGIKKYQATNQKLFVRKWEHALNRQYANYPSNIEQAKERHIVGRVLVIDALVPTPDQDSGSLRMYSLLKIMRDMSLKVTFIPDNLSWVEGYTEALQKIGIEVLYHHYLSSIDDYLKQHGSDFNIVWLSRANETEKHIDDIRRYCKRALVIFDTVDLHFLREERQAEMENKLLLRQMAKRRKAQELALMKKADVTLVVSPVEQQVLRRENKKLSIEIVTNIHIVYGSETAHKDRRGIVFIGGFNHPPNIDAVKHFVKDIFPIIRKELSGVKFFVVGSNPPKNISSLASEDVIVTGYVPDISCCFNQCMLSVAPLRYGAGVKGKINTSMSYGVPVVTTIIGAEGMFL
ncbi:MAG: glycosyltransferase, partial [Gammaproteobacteria bacterium]